MRFPPAVADFRTAPRFPSPEPRVWIPREVAPTATSYGGNDMQGARRVLVAAALGALLTATSAATATAAAKHGSHHRNATAERVFTLAPDPAGNPEGIAVDSRTGKFYVGITADGAIYQGMRGSDTIEPFIAGATGGSAVGLKVRKGKLYVAGGATGAIKVYDLETKARVASFDTGPDGFLNDLVVTRRGDVFVTDSFRPTLWHVTAARSGRHRRGAGARRRGRSRSRPARST